MDITELREGRPLEVKFDQRVRPFAPLTPVEKWKRFIEQTAVRALAGVIIGAVVVGYFFGTRKSEPATTFSKQTSNTFSSSTSTTEKISKIKVYVAGAVNSPGVIEIESSARVTDAIAAAGGTSPTADLINCNLAGFLADGASIQVPSKGNSSPGKCGESSATSSIGQTGSSGAGIVAGGKVNLNTASQTEIETLPGIGPTMGAAIIAYRTQHGSFSSINDLRKVKGIGDKRFADLKDQVTI